MSLMRGSHMHTNLPAIDEWFNPNWDIPIWDEPYFDYTEKLILQTKDVNYQVKKLEKASKPYA